MYWYVGLIPKELSGERGNLQRENYVDVRVAGSRARALGPNRACRGTIGNPLVRRSE
jgi:hypothetical protein